MGISHRRMEEHSCVPITTCHTMHGFPWVKDGHVGTGCSGFLDPLKWLYPGLKDLYIGKKLLFLVDFCKVFTESSYNIPINFFFFFFSLQKEAIAECFRQP